MSLLLRLQDTEIGPIAWELGQNQFQMAGLARVLAKKRGGATRSIGYDRQDQELAVAIFRAAFVAGEDPPRDPDLRELTREERRFVLGFLGPDPDD